ncbi:MULTISPECIES: hypothetical protein [unclassified Streptomyces]|uniref:hypothetical protein n=1 Tax=unclassified Streptomyces TaxID=2593676 RepID=UPI00224CCD22|nr:hypothetical protein [Streptomyces sp. NBC_00893]
MRFGRANAGGGTNVTGSGNQVNTGRVGGDMRQVQVSGTAADDPRLLAAQARLAELVAALDTHADEVHSIDSCRQAVARIDEELREPTPDGRRLTETLEMLSLALGSATSLTSLAGSLRNAIEALLS